MSFQLRYGSVQWSEHTQQFTATGVTAIGKETADVANWAVAHHPPTLRLIEARQAAQYQLTQSEERIEQLIKELDASRRRNHSLYQRVNEEGERVRELQQKVDGVSRDRDLEMDERVRTLKEADILRKLLDERESHIRELRKEMGKTVRERDVATRASEVAEEPEAVEQREAIERKLDKERAANAVARAQAAILRRERDTAVRERNEARMDLRVVKRQHEETLEEASKDHERFAEERETVERKLDAARKELAELPERLAVRLGEHHANVTRLQLGLHVAPVEEAPTASLLDAEEG